MKEIKVKLTDSQYDKFKSYCDDNGIEPGELLRSYILSEYMEIKTINNVDDFPNYLEWEDNKYFRLTVTNLGASYCKDKGSFDKDNYLYVDRYGNVTYRDLNQYGKYSGKGNYLFAKIISGNFILEKKVKFIPD